MTEKHFVVATAGHVDHGKSALVKALTGTDPDRLPEEKAREITIDLGFAHLDLPFGQKTAGAPSATLSVSIIDVPGHEDFVRNMIAGLGSIDLALLVVAADDGWMPQTEEHLQILSYLGVNRMVVALNKSDIGQAERTVRQIREQLRKTRFADAPIVSTSTRTGNGVEELKQALASVLRNATPQRDIGKTRLLIDRAFNLSGIGTVVTGTLSGGSIRAGQPVYLQPGNFPTRARSLQTHRTNLDMAHPGMRTGINLAEVPKNFPDSLRRGSVLTTEQFEATSAIDAWVERSARLSNSHPTGRPLKSGTAVYLHHGTARIAATLILADTDALQAGECSLCQLRLASPILAFIGDRFVIRDRSEQHTIAGGVILDPNGQPKSFRTTSQRTLLGARAANPFDAAVCLESELVRRGPVLVPGLLRNSNFSEAEVRAALIQLQESQRVIVRGNIAADITSWRALQKQAADLIDTTHRTRPDQKGLELTELRAAWSACSAEVVEALIDDLCANGYVRRGSVIARTSHRPQLPPQLEPRAKAILAALAEKPLDPPARTRVAPDAAHFQALRYLVQSGDVVELGSDLLLSREAFAQAKDIVVRVISTTGSATVSQLREALHTSRRVAVPLLERLDRDRVTSRVGDQRFLPQQSAVTAKPR